jgi:hypothetical protein
VLGDGVPRTALEFLEVAFVLGIEDDRLVGPVDDDVRNQRPLRAGVVGLPAKLWDNY